MKRIDELEKNAFVDGELSPDQQAELLEALRDDPTLAREICGLQNIKARIKLAYEQPPQPVAAAARRGYDGWRSLAAGLALLGLGMLGGWLLHPQPAAQDRFVMLDADGRGQAPAQADSRETRIVFHLTNPDQTTAGELLDDVEDMLAAYRADSTPLRVEIVSHGEGLGLLRASLSQHRRRISSLAGEYSNLTFVACQNTMTRLQVEKGIEVRLLPEAEVTDSGVSHVVRRQREGWTYIRV